VPGRVRIVRMMTAHGPSHPLGAEDAASRVSAFVYGNILVLAALIALSPEQAAAVTGVAVVVGTGLSTLIAHVVADVVGDQVRSGADPDWARVRAHIRDAAPIASSTALPAVLLLAGRFGWLPAEAALVAAMAVPTVRVAFLGGLIRHYRGETSTRAVVYGIVLAVVCAAVAALEWWLTHH